MSITETPNELTQEIDCASPLGIVRLLRQTDSQIYNGYLTYPGLCDKEILEKLEDCIEQTRKILSAKGKKVIVIAGAGTSGRLAMFLTRSMNHLLKNSKRDPIFRYLIAGGDKALIAAQEGSEDDPYQGVRDLKQIIGDTQTVGYFGVTCGLSAPYVAGQLDYLLEQFDRKLLKGFACLHGFNPVDRARNTPIENWNKTFLQVAKKVEKHKQCIILNPVVGPEPITGSTRMKSGSATKLCLEIVFHQAFSKPVGATGRSSLPIGNYESTRIAVYEQEENLARLIELGAQALRNKRHIYYLGKAPYGILGLIDASECPPTYGADFEDIRGFLDGGWDSLLGKGRDMSHHGDLYRIGIDEFTQSKLPNLRKHDLVIELGQGTPSYLNLLRQAKQKGANTASILIQSKSVGATGRSPSPVDININPIIPYSTPFKEYAMKLLVNALTTGAHVRIGKVYQNRMIDLKISNNKLYFRTIAIISSIMKVDEETALRCTLKAIYETDRVTPALLKKKVSDHISASTGKHKVVPKAMLLATGKFTYKSASQALAKEPIVRNIIQKYVSGL